MKKIILLFFCLFLTISVFSQSDFDNTDDYVVDEYNLSGEILKLRREINSIKKDIAVLKEKTKWMTFKIEGSVKTTYGVNIWQRPDQGGFNVNTPITHGFDFENNIKFNWDIGNTIIGSSRTDASNGTQIKIDLEIKSLGITDIKPEGSWYVVQGRDDQDNTTDIYFPRYEAGSSNIVFGNFQIALKEAKVDNIAGTGIFISYKDVMEVQQYYGVQGMVEIMKLNHDYFNNGFIIDSGNNEEYASLYYSFDDDDYDPENGTAEAVKLWSNKMLHEDPNDSDYNQKPHGISFGWDKRLSDGTQGFHMYLEGGVASKDAFDPKYYLDNNVDYGFFAKVEPLMFDEKKFEFHPKLGLAFAFQTETTEDMRWEWSTFAAGLSLPFKFYLPTGPNDYLNLDFNWNMNVYIVKGYFATILSFTPEIVFLDQKLKFSLPFVYSFKNTGERGGFLRVGHADVETHDGVYWFDQLYDDHILNLGLNMTFDSRNLFGDIFQYVVTNNTYFSYIREWDYRQYRFRGSNEGDWAEIYFYNIHRHEFIFNNFGVDKLGFFVEFGVGLAYNAKLVDTQTVFKYTYDRENDSYIDNDPYNEMSWNKWTEATVIGITTGMYLDIMKNLSLGLDVESPKIHVGDIRAIGNQQSYGVFKLWTEIKF